jgi:hypothetical protein
VQPVESAGVAFEGMCATHKCRLHTVIREKRLAPEDARRWMLERWRPTIASPETCQVPGCARSRARVTVRTHKALRRWCAYHRHFVLDRSKVRKTSVPVEARKLLLELTAAPEPQATPPVAQPKPTRVAPMGDPAMPDAARVLRAVELVEGLARLVDGLARLVDGLAR